MASYNNVAKDYYEAMLAGTMPASSNPAPLVIVAAPTGGYNFVNITTSTTTVVKKLWWAITVGSNQF